MFIVKYVSRYHRKGAKMGIYKMINLQKFVRKIENKIFYEEIQKL